MNALVDSGVVSYVWHTTALLPSLPLKTSNCKPTAVTVARFSSHISIDSLYLIPGSSTRLTRICLGEDNLLLVYADGKARLWDVKTQEFWRSMTSKSANELLKQGGWFEA